MLHGPSAVARVREHEGPLASPAARLAEKESSLAGGTGLTASGKAHTTCALVITNAQPNRSNARRRRPLCRSARIRWSRAVSRRRGYRAVGCGDGARPRRIPSLGLPRSDGIGRLLRPAAARCPRPREERRGNRPQDRGSGSVSRTAFIANRPSAATRAASSVFFDSHLASASRRISISMVLRPSSRSRSRMRSSSRRTSELPTTGSSDPTAATPPSLINRRQRYSRLGATPRRRATEDTVSPGSRLSSMICSFCSVAQCRRRAVPVISSMRR